MFLQHAKVACRVVVANFATAVVLFSVLWDDLAILLAGAFSPKGDHGPLSAKALSGCSPGVTWHGFRHTLEQAVSPTSYPTTSTRRWMRPIANARTDPKVYVDCHGDYRISSIIYTNRLSTSRGQSNTRFLFQSIVPC